MPRQTGAGCDRTELQSLGDGLPCVSMGATALHHFKCTVSGTHIVSGWACNHECKGQAKLYIRLVSRSQPTTRHEALSRKPPPLTRTKWFLGGRPPSRWPSTGPDLRRESLRILDGGRDGTWSHLDGGRAPPSAPDLRRGDSSGGVEGPRRPPKGSVGEPQGTLWGCSG